MMATCIEMSRPTPGGTRRPADPFRRLVEIYRENAWLMDELEAVGGRLGSARAYREGAGGPTALADAYIDRLRARRSAALALLRSNRREVRDLLSPGAAGGRDGARCA